jgi:hypothetical protein
VKFCNFTSSYSTDFNNSDLPVEARNLYSACGFVLKYEGQSEMIWTHLIGSNFIIFGLNTKQLLSQYVLLLGQTSPLSPWEFPDGFTESFCVCVAIPLMCSVLATVEAPYPVNTVLRAAAFSPQTADNRK